MCQLGNDSQLRGYRRIAILIANLDDATYVFLRFLLFALSEKFYLNSVSIEIGTWPDKVASLVFESSKSMAVIGTKTSSADRG